MVYFKGFILFLIFGLTSPFAAAQTHMRDDFKRPDTIPFPEHAIYSPQIAALGKMLFFDPRLSGAKNMNCVSCHNPSFGFETPVPTAIGAANKPLKRHAPTTLNLAWVAPLFFDGRAETLEEQARGPITAADEMNGKFADIIPELEGIPYYKEWFDRLFPDQGVSEKNILTALATYQRTIVSGWAPFDRWVAGDEQAISEEAQKGFELFVGKAKCVTCHSGWNFTDNQFHDIGLYSEDIGRAALEPDNIKALYAFKTPGLRNLTYRAPFMHDGSLDNLEAVIAHYIGGIEKRPSLSPSLSEITLSESERAHLLSFLQSLTAEKIDPSFPILPN